MREEKNSYIWAFFMAQSTKNSGLMGHKKKFTLKKVQEMFPELFRGEKEFLRG
jgi:hypothetical protein